MGFQRIFGLLSGAFGARDASDELPLVYRAAILYLALPAGVWLVGWFEWWVWLPLGALSTAALWPALRGNWRLRREDVRPEAVAVAAVAGAWVMATAAGGIFDFENGDWNQRRLVMLDLGRYAWPVFLPETLGIYAAGDYPDPLLRMYLGWYIMPGLAAKLFGAWALNWAIPLWTWAGLSLVMMMFARGRRGWSLALALLIFAFFSGMDILRGAILQDWGALRPDLDAPGIMGLEFPVLDWRWLGPVQQYSSSITAMAWVPHHFISAGICAMLLIRLRGNGRFLGACGMALAMTAFWSAFVAVGLLPLIGVLIWQNGVRPFLTWQNLLAAPALGGVIALYLASGSLDYDPLWLWERKTPLKAALWAVGVCLSEFLALSLLLLALRPGLRREPMFIAAVLTLLLLPLYRHSGLNAFMVRAATPPLIVICFYCACALVPVSGRLTLRGGALGRIGVACAVAMLAAGAFTGLYQLMNGLNHFGLVRYERLANTMLIDSRRSWIREFSAPEPSAALLALLADEPLPSREKGMLAASGNYDAFLERDRIVLVKESAGEDCRSRMNGRFFLAVAPSDGSVPFRSIPNPQDVRARLFGDTCVVRLPLPEYGISGFALGERRDDGSVEGWMVHNFDFDGIADSLTAGDPVARAEFDIYLRGNMLVYAKWGCGLEDTRARFFLHIVPADRWDLPLARLLHGFENMDFWFDDYGLRAAGGDVCVAARELPDYEIAELRTGQLGAGGKIWSETLTLGRR